MTDCTNTDVRDALPDLAHGRLGEVDRATMTAHVESCAACRAELALMLEIRDAAPLAPPMNAARIAAAIAPYGNAAVLLPADAPRRGSSAWTLPLLAAAAIAVIAVGNLAIGRGNTPSATPVTHVDIAATVGADRGASPVPAASVDRQGPPAGGAAPAPAATTGRGSNVATLSLAGGTQDLSEAELEALLAGLDGMETLPSEEPHSVIYSIENIEDGA